MKFAIHLDLSARAPLGPDSERQTFDAAIETAILAEELGFELCWASEHHFLTEYSHMPAPEILLASIAARTSVIRLGMCVQAQAATHPVFIAERAAVLDVLSHGRAELAVGRPATLAESTGLSAGQPLSEDVWNETLRALPQLWTSEQASLAGGKFELRERAVLPKPYQKPHLPLWAAACDARGAGEAAGAGAGLLMNAMGDQRVLAQQVAAYKNSVGASSPAGAFVNDQVALVDLLYCHTGDAQGAETGARLVAEARALSGQQAAARELGLRGSLTGPTGLAVGEPQAIISVLRRWESMGVDQVALGANAGQCLEPEEVAQSLRLFADEVMPAFKRQRTRAAAE